MALLLQTGFTSNRQFLRSTQKYSIVHDVDSCRCWSFRNTTVSYLGQALTFRKQFCLSFAGQAVNNGSEPTF